MSNNVVVILRQWSIVECMLLRVHVESRGSLGMMLMFDRVEASDRGRYTCTSASKDTATFELAVVSKYEL